VLRFWETKFAQIKPLKRGGGRRYYKPDDIDLVKGIKHLLYGTGYTIKGVQRILKDQGTKHVQSIGRTGEVQPIEIKPNAHVAAAHVTAPNLALTQTAPPSSKPIPEAEPLRAPKRVNRKISQLGLFGDDDNEDESEALSPANPVRSRSSASLGVSRPIQALTRLEAVLNELEECNRLIASVQWIKSGEVA
jgi:DNA-binding transcriptional MerR regulator